MDKHVACFGEVLFDVFSNRRCIGGAPLNVAYRLQSLGNSVDLISKIGDDDLGYEILHFLRQNQIKTRCIQIDGKYKTGKVKVTLDSRGNASYDIVKPSAWDFIEFNAKALEAVRHADAFVFGSLVCRNEASKTTLIHLLKEAKYKIFDVNLRRPHYEMAFIKQLMVQADVLKFNEEEVLYINEALGHKTLDLKKAILHISKFASVHTICVTRGDKGAILFKNDMFFEHPGRKVKVIDTVGAGDSFLAALIDHFLKDKSPDQSLEFACSIGSKVAGQEGATCQI